jgi:hypothetical protein
LRQRKKQAGGEPDESYCIGIDKAFPDLAIEVVVTSGGINRLDLFHRLGQRISSATAIATRISLKLSEPYCI